MKTIEDSAELAAMITEGIEVKGPLRDLLTQVHAKHRIEDLITPEHMLVSILFASTPFNLLSTWEKALGKTAVVKKADLN